MKRKGQDDELGTPSDSRRRLHDMRCCFGVAKNRGVGLVPIRRPYRHHGKPLTPDNHKRQDT